MYNMLNIALSEVDVVATPSRATYSLKEWIDQRESNVYPGMPEYQESLSKGALRKAGRGFLDISSPVKLPDALRGERYAFVSLPLSEFREGGGVTAEVRLWTTPCRGPDGCCEAFLTFGWSFIPRTEHRVGEVVPD